MKKFYKLAILFIFIHLQSSFASFNEALFVKDLQWTQNSKKIELDTISAVERKGKIAILPFRIIIDKIVASDEEAIKGQTSANELLQGHIGELVLQDVSVTNSKLFKAGITQANFKGYTSKEFCEILGVEFVVQVLAEITSKDVATVNSSSTNGGNKRTTYSKTYDAKSQVSIINDQGESVFNDTRKPFFMLNEVGSYFASVAYLLKRSPIYKQ